MKRWIAVILGAVTIGGTTVAAIAMRKAGARPSLATSLRPPVWAPVSHQVIKALPGRKLILARYRIVNRTSRAVEFGETSSSCGCTVASIEPRQVVPGAEAIVTLEGKPPDAGAKRVRVGIVHDGPGRRITLALTMIGAMKPPFIVTHTGPVQFGSLTDQTKVATERVHIEAREERAALPWLGQVIGADSPLVVTGGMVKEQAIDEGVVTRSYDYRISIRKVELASGEFSGGVRLGQVGHSGVHDTIEVHGRSLPPVTVSPPTLYAGLNRGDAAPVLHFVVRSSGTPRALRCEPRPESLEHFDIRLVEGRPDRLRYDVRPKGAVRQSMKSRIESSTNDPRQPIVSIPVRLVVQRGE